MTLTPTLTFILTRRLPLTPYLSRAGNSTMCRSRLVKQDAGEVVKKMLQPHQEEKRVTTQGMCLGCQPPIACTCLTPAQTLYQGPFRVSGL